MKVEMEDRKMAEFLAWFCRQVYYHENFYISGIDGDIWIEDDNEIGDQQISFEEVVRRYNKSLPEYVPSILEPHIDSINKLIDAKSQEVAIEFFDWALQRYWDLGSSRPCSTDELFLKYKQSKDDRDKK